jgi:DNA polymerase/3'-5' exonuclease PolX
VSAGRPVRLELARPLARELVDLLRPACHRIEIAGSIRREKPLVSDIEIVAMPIVEEQSANDLWATPVPVNLLTGPTGPLQQLAAMQLLWPRRVEIVRAGGTVEHQVKLGEAYKALVYRDVPVDLFLVSDPDSWGVIFALRTGPGDWNTRLVTDAHRYLRRVEGGHLYRAGQKVPCPEERDFFNAIGQEWVEPPDRAVHRVNVQARLAGAPA